MSKRIMTLDDLYAFFSEGNKDVVFNAKEKDTSLAVQVKATLTFDKKPDGGLLPVHLQSCHTGLNANGYNISETAMGSAMPSFTNRPILAFIYEDSEGNPQFHAHDAHKDEDGNVVRDEIAVGIIPESNNATLNYDSEKNKTYLEVDGYIFENITKAAEILKRDGECACSVELDIDELHYDSAKKFLDITAFSFIGVTILGVEEDGTPVQPGMEGANITLADFSKGNNSMFNAEQLVEQVSELQKKFEELSEAFSIQNLQKGGNESQMTKFEELLEKYSKTAEDVAFEYEGLSDEELEAKFAEAFESDSEESNAEEASESAEAESIADVAVLQYEKSYINKDGEVKTFAISMDEKWYALNALVWGSYEDCDVIDVFEGDNEVDNYVIISNYATRETLKQNYAFDSENYSLVGEPVAVTCEWLTNEEKTTLETMRRVYPDMEAKLQHYEEEPKKLEVLNSSDYAGVEDNAEFVALKSMDAHFEMSVDEVKAKADEILLNAAKSNSLNFEKKTETQATTMKAVQTEAPKKSGRYGNLFRK